MIPHIRFTTKNRQEIQLCEWFRKKRAYMGKEGMGMA